ncbi:histidine kinase [Flammeovirgaceae bacterium 311]|nr:histidine kinase [Flammeovirgaceae bacterium 311]
MLLVSLLPLTSIALQKNPDPAVPADSLEVQLILAEEPQKMQLLLSLSEIYLERDPDMALNRAKQALTLARRINDKRSEAIALKNTGNALRYLLSDYEAALDYCHKALKISEEGGFKLEEAEILHLIGDIYYEVGNSYKAIEHYMQALALSESLSLYPVAVDILNDIGRVYATLGNDQKAIEYHKKALRISKTNEHVPGVASSNYWLAITYTQVGNLDLALEKQHIALALRQNMKNTEGQALCYLAIGKVYHLKTDYDKALKQIDNAYQLYGQIGDTFGRASAMNQMGAILIEKKEYEQAISQLKLALHFGEQLNNKKIIRDSYEYLYNCYAGLRDYEQALRYKDLFIAISDFIYGEESERRMAELQNRFEIEQKESEIAVLKKDRQLRDLALQEQANFRNFLIILLVLMCVIIALVLYLYRNHRRSNLQLKSVNEQINSQNGELQELNATKDKFFSIISHDLKGPLNSLTSFAGLLINHTEALSKDEIKMLATDLDKSLKNLLSLLNNLLEWSRSQTGNLDIKAEPFDVRELVYANAELLQRMAENKEITLRTRVPNSLTGFADKNQMNTVLRNLISNALKFTEKGGKVEVDVNEWKDAIEVAVRDSGVGMSKAVLAKLFKIEHKYSTNGTANESGTGLGLMLCKEFVERSGGMISVESEEGKGSTFRFTIPKHKGTAEPVLAAS